MHRLKAALPLLALLGLAQPARAAEPQAPTARTAPSEANVVYGMYSGLALLMDVRRPAKPNGYAVLNIPGSGWQADLGWDALQLKDDPKLNGLEQPLLDQGFTVFTINHRATPRFRFPAPVEDAQRAARFIRANATRFGVDAERLAVIGASSGGHLAAMLATEGEGSLKTPFGAPAPEPLRPACVVAVMPPTDLRPLGTDGWGVGLATSFIGHPPVYGGPDRPTDPDSFDVAYLAASPVEHVDARTSPMLLIHGDKDQLVPIAQSQLLADRIRKAGGKVELVTMPGVAHAFPAPYPTQAAAWLRRCITETRR